MATTGDIQAGRAAISVVLDDAGIQPQLQSLAARLKTASAGLSAATMPTLGAEAAAPGRDFAARAASLNKQFADGLRSPAEMTAELNKLQASLMATATPAQALGVQFARLDADLQRGAITGTEYQQQLTRLTAAFTASAGPVDRLQGNIVALDRDLRTGAITESEYRTALAQLTREFTAGAPPADRYAAEIATLDAQLRQGQITQEQHTAAVRQAKTAMESSQQAAAGSKSIFGSLGSQIATLAAGYVSWTTILHLAGQALEYVRQETEKAKASQDSLVDSRRRLAQVATSETDLASMLERADQAAMKFGVDRKKAQEAMFQARSEGWEADYETVMQNATVVDPSAAAGVAGQVPALFRQTEQIGTEQAVSGTLMAAQQSRLDFEAIARSLPQAAEGVSQARGSFAETAGALGVLAGRFKSGDTAAERIKLFAAKLAQNADTAGLGLIGGFDALVAAGEDAQNEFLGQSVELRAAFQIMGEEMPAIREQAAKIQAELDAISAGGPSMLDRQRGIAEADTAEQARLERVRSAIEKERETERLYAIEGNKREAAHNREMSRVQREGVGIVDESLASMAGATAQTFRQSPESVAAAIRAVAGPDERQRQGLLDLVIPNFGREPLAAEAETARLKEEIAETQRRLKEMEAERGDAAGEIPAFAEGTPLITQTGLAEVHAGEAVVPAESVGPWKDTAGMPAALPPNPAATSAAREMERAGRQYAADFSAAMDSGARSIAAKAEADQETADAAQSYADQFAEAMGYAGERTQRAIDADKASAAGAQDAADDFAAAMDAAGDATARAIDEERAGGKINEFDAGLMQQAREAELRRQQTADDIERKAREAVDGPQLTSAGTFSGYRLGGQLGQATKTAEQQLAEARKQTAALDRLNDTLERKETVYP